MQLKALFDRIAALEAKLGSVDERCIVSEGAQSRHFATQSAFSAQAQNPKCPLGSTDGTSGTSVDVSMEFTVPNDEASQWSTSNVAFTSAFAGDIAAALGIDPSRIHVKAVTKTTTGSTTSVKVDFEVLPPAGGSTGQTSYSAIGIKAKLTEQLGNPDSQLLKGSFTSRVNTAAQIGATTQSVKRCDDGSWPVSGVCPEKATNRDYLYIAMAFVPLLLVIGGVIYYHQTHKNRPKAPPADVEGHQAPASSSIATPPAPIEPSVELPPLASLSMDDIVRGVRPVPISPASKNEVRALQQEQAIPSGVIHIRYDQ